LNKVPTLNELNSLGVLSGRLSEIHLENLKAFPFIYYNGVLEAKLEYDIYNKQDGTYIRYDLTLSEENDQLDKRFRALEVAIKALFWKDMALKVSINGNEQEYE
jgi:hypothetical protein